MNDFKISEQTAWAVNPYPWREAHSLAAALDLPVAVAMVLAGRGITEAQEARTFLECSYSIPDPFLFGGMAGAVACLSAAIDRRARIVVHGDYDADGITATAVMLLGLREFGIEAEWYLPNRFNEGYGLSRAAVESIAAGGPAVLVTVDCGVNYPDEVALARRLGLDVVVVDHHQPGPVLPDCHLVHSVVGDYPHGDLCGVGLALKVMHALFVERAGVPRDAVPPVLEKLLDLVAIGTVADLAPLRGENRYYVKEGLKLVGIGQRVGVRALASVAACTGVVDSGTVAYRLAPRLNAAGRLSDPSPPLRLLLTDDEEEARSLAAMLHELNGARQDVERQIFEQAIGVVEGLRELPPALVLAGPEWHEGVVGIVASRLVERYHRPTILLGVREGVAKGSGRSVGGYDLMAGLTAGAEYLTVYGGHKQAVGLTLAPDRVDSFRRVIEEHAGASLQPADLAPVYIADVVLRGDEVNADTALALASLGPFGSGNPRPKVLLVDASVLGAEVTRNGAHLRCAIEVDGVRARGIGFGLGAALPDLCRQPRGRVVGAQFRVDEWQGNLRPEFLVEAIGTPRDESADGGQQGRNGRTVGCSGDPNGGSSQRQPEESLEAATVLVAARGRSARPAAAGLPGANDLRDSRVLTSAIAQVLASGERVWLLTHAVASTLPAMGARLPLPALCGDLGCYGRGSREVAASGSQTARVAMVEWETLGGAGETFAGAWTAATEDRATAHIVALDPPFRPAHVSFLREAVDAGATLHLCYGSDERLATARFLRYVVHPRFAMVCVYRAMQEEESGHEQFVARAADIAWREGGVVLTADDLDRAAGILEQLGVGRGSSLEAKLEARSAAAYVAAEADYEECSRYCLTM